MPVQKSAKSPKSASGTPAKAASKAATTVKAAAKAPAKAAPVKAAAAAPKAAPKVKTVSTPKTAAELKKAADELLKKKPARAKAAAAEPEVAEEAPKKKPGRPAKAAGTTAAAKAPAKRGRKPKAKEEGLEDDADLSDIESDLEGEPEAEVVEAAEAAPVEKAKPLRMKISKAKERALMKEFGLDETVLSEEDMAKRRSQLKKLITLGKTRGYLTQVEISDHLPDKLVDAETMEVVVAMLGDMGVAVYEQTPDAETLFQNNVTPTATTVEEAEEEAEAALSTVDSEFGRTTDPVRMYMREMGTVELLTREGEIEIAKRIEGGLMDMMEAISASPATIAEILNMGEEIREGKVVISTVVDGFSNPNEADDYVAEEDFDEFDEEDDDDGKGGSKALTKKLEELKNEALRRFDTLRALFEKMHKIYDKDGYGGPAYMKVQHEISAELMTIRFTAKTIEKLCDMVRAQVDDVRKKERELRRIIVDKCGMPQETFIKDFPANLLNLQWVEKQAAAGKPWSAVMQRNIPPIQELQQKLMDLQARVVVPLSELKEINKRMNAGEASSRDAKKEMIEANLRLVISIAKKYTNRDEGGGQVRIPPRLQVLDLRHVVDPPGDHTIHRGSSSNHPHPGAHDRDHQQDEPHQPPAPAGVRLRARCVHPGREDGDPRGQDPQDHEDRQGADLDGNPHRRRRRQPPGRLHRGQQQHRTRGRRHAGRPARRGEGHPRRPDPARSQGAAHALRHRNVHRPHAGRSGQAVRRDARTHPPDRGQGAAQAQAPEPLGQAAQLHRLAVSHASSAHTSRCQRPRRSAGAFFIARQGFKPNRLFTLMQQAPAAIF